MGEKSTDEILKHCELCGITWEKLSYNARARLRNKYYEYYHGIPAYGKKRALCPICEESVSSRNINKLDSDKINNMSIDVNYSGGMREELEEEMISLFERYGYNLHKNKYSDDMKNKSLVFGVGSKKNFNIKCFVEDF